MSVPILGSRMGLTCEMGNSCGHLFYRSLGIVAGDVAFGVAGKSSRHLVAAHSFNQSNGDSAQVWASSLVLAAKLTRF